MSHFISFKKNLYGNKGINEGLVLKQVSKMVCQNYAQINSCKLDMV
jgi:hypothetical protein